MTDTTTLATSHDTETIEGLANLLRERLARGERPTQNGDSFSMFILMEAMNIVHDEMLDQDHLELCVLRVKTLLRLELPPTPAGFDKHYLDAAFRVIHREQLEQEQALTGAAPVI